METKEKEIHRKIHRGYVSGVDGITLRQESLQEARHARFLPIFVSDLVKELVELGLPAAPKGAAQGGC
jgi:hypothetical protein